LPRFRKLLLWTSGLVLAYTLIGFFILPPILRAVIVKRLSGELNRRVTAQRIKLNPYTLSATVRGLRIEDQGWGAPPLMG
jgi:hypothetical protein